MKQPKNATHKSKGVNPTYYQKMQSFNGFRAYSKNTGKLLNTIHVYSHDRHKDFLIEV